MPLCYNIYNTYNPHLSMMVGSLKLLVNTVSTPPCPPRSPGGLALELFKSVPYGKRAILVAKQKNVDELFNSAPWIPILEKKMDKKGDNNRAN